MKGHMNDPKAYGEGAKDSKVDSAFYTVMTNRMNEVTTDPHGKGQSKDPKSKLAIFSHMND